MSGASKYNLNEAYFELVNSADKAYWIGVMAADGYIQSLSKSKLRLVFEVSKADQSWVEEFLNDVQSNHPIVSRSRKDSDYGARESVSVSITRHRFVAPLFDMQIKTSRVFDFIPADLMPHFIRGVFDGDGCIVFERDKPRHTGYVPTRYRWILTSHSEDFLKQVQIQLFRSCDINPSKLLFNKAWRLQVGGSRQVKRIGDYLYPFGEYPFLARKREKMPCSPL